MTTHWTTSWNYVGGDCGDFGFRFDTEHEAVEFGEDWATEMNAEAIASGDLTRQDVDDGVDGTATFWTFRHEVADDGSSTVYDEWDKPMFDRTPDGEIIRPSRLVVDSES